MTRNMTMSKSVPNANDCAFLIAHTWVGGWWDGGKKMTVGGELERGNDSEDKNKDVVL